MKIVIISKYIFPRQSPRAFRATELAKFFAADGHDVLLYAVLGQYDYTDFEKKTRIKVCSIGRLLFTSINSEGVERCNFINRFLRRFLGRILEFPDIELALKTYYCVKKNNDVDLMITIAMPHPIHWGAAFAKKMLGEKFPKVWVSDCGDPYMGNTVGKRPPLYFRLVENFWGKQTDYISIPIEGGRQGYSKEVQNKIRIIPQGFDFSNVELDKSFVKNKIPRFAYAGAIYLGYRDPTKMLQYLVTLKDIQYVFVVYTKNKEFFSEYKRDMGDKLIIRDYVPREQLLFELSQMDFLVNILNDSIVQSPSKLIDYYLTKRPIIDINTEFHEQENLMNFLLGNYSHKHVRGNISKYDICNVGRQFLELAI